MKQVCRYYRASECLNPNCRFAHPAEYPVYIYTAPGIEIHPDELRIAVMGNEEVVREADNAWLSNYAMFCQENVDKDVDILEHPDYFCMPFDVDRVGTEIENLRKTIVKYPGDGFSSSGSFTGGGYRQYDNRRQSKPYDRGRGYDNGSHAGRGYTDSNRGFGGGRMDTGQQGSWYGKNRGGFSQSPNSGGYQPRAPERQRDSSFGGRPGGVGQQSGKPWRSSWQDQGSQPRYSRQNEHDAQNAYGRSRQGGYGGQNMNTGHRAFVSSSDHPSGFDRAPDLPKKSPDGNDGSADYEYHNIPYNYR